MQQENALTVSPTFSLGSLRAHEVLQEILSIKSTIMDKSLLLGRLLREARDNRYNLDWGFSRFDDWVEEASGLDMSARHAYDLIKVVERSESLGIPDEELKQVKLSKLKTIFSLPADTDEGTVRELVEKAKHESLDAIREDVGKIKNLEWVYRTIKIERSVDENVYQPALERARLEFGNTMGHDGGPTDISDGRCVEMWAAEFLARPEEQDREAIDAEFEDFADYYSLPEEA